jgi:hypothetical protein
MWRALLFKVWLFSYYIIRSGRLASKNSVSAKIVCSMQIRKTMKAEIRTGDSRLQVKSVIILVGVPKCVA